MNHFEQTAYGPVRQLAYVVPNIETAVDRFHRQMGIGPFAVARNVRPLDGSSYRGEPSNGVEINLAFGYMGDIQLELIEPLNDEPSLYREAVQQGAHSVHHYGFCVEDFGAAYQHATDNGFQSVVDAGVPGIVQMAYLESMAISGLMIELIQWNDLTRPYFDGVRQFLAEADTSQLIHDYQI